MSTALIVIDMQESFRQRPSWSAVSNPNIVDRVARLVQEAREYGATVFWVLHSDPNSNTVFDPKSGFVHLLDGLEAHPDEPVVTKTSRNAFTTTNLGQQLTAAGISRLVIAGIQTEQCCETTARVGADLGYEVVFVTEATATFPVTRPDTGQTLGAQEMIERTEYALAGRFARISTIGQAFAAAATPIP